jgi:flavin-dependent dehydrogenase
MPLFDRLGVRKEVEAMGITKNGAEFVSPWHDHTSHFLFAEAMDKSFPYAVHVRRSEFDEMLFRHAAKRGARTFEGHRVTAVTIPAETENDGRTLVKVQTDEGVVIEWRPRFVVDASGRDTLLANQMDVKRRSKAHASAALYGHFTHAIRQPSPNEGNISLFWFDHGCF